MKIYVVGGAVRDQLLGLPVQDRDYVVVGATPRQMLDAGFKPVGQDFPVFLHPKTHEEYALARTERKVAPGYAGFQFHSAPQVTLEEDLQRRDLTINAIAQDDHGRLIDPYGGQADLRARIFRHVSTAFAEDPVRILRLARFAARFADFSVAPETLTLMRQMVSSGEVDALVPERVWQELARGLMQATPSRMFEVLIDCDALSHLAPECADLVSRDDHWLRAIDWSAAEQASLPQRFALWGLALSAASHYRDDQARDKLLSLCERFKVPNDCRDLATLAVQEQWAIGMAGTGSASERLDVLSRIDAFRKPERFAELLRVIGWHQRSLGDADQARLAASQDALRRALMAASSVDAGQVAQRINQQVERQTAAPSAARGDAIKRAVYEARLAAIAASMAVTGHR